MKTKNLASILSVLLISLAFGHAAAQGFQHADSLRITYIANYGALLQAGDKRVLIDGLFRQGVEGYARVPKVLLRDLEKNRGPFAGADVLLVSHPHADHFDASSVAAHLRKNSKAVLLSSQQVVSATHKALDGDANDRLIEVTPEWKHREKRTVAGIEIDILRIRHGYAHNYSLQNLGHILHLGGKKILHIGDAEMISENFALFDLPAEKIDVALLPYWFLTSASGSKIVRELIQPKAIIAMHIEPAQVSSISAEIAESFPSAHVFTRPMEKLVF